MKCKSLSIMMKHGDFVTAGTVVKVGKSHYHVFLGGLDPGQAPLKTLLLMLRQT